MIEMTKGVGGGGSSRIVQVAAIERENELIPKDPGLDTLAWATFKKRRHGSQPKNSYQCRLFHQSSNVKLQC